MADWYVKSADGLGPWWANFILRRAEFEAKYPILATLKVELNAIGAWVDYWVEARHVFDELSKQQTSYFNSITGNDSSLDPPAEITWTMPPGKPAEVPPGFEKTIRDVRREVVGLKNYAKADGEALGFEATAPQAANPVTVKPSIQVFAAAHDYGVTIVVTGREGAIMWDVYVIRKGGNRTKLTTGEGKSADVIIVPTVPGDAEQVQLEIQLRKNNLDFGQPSNPVYVTINP